MVSAMNDPLVLPETARRLDRRAAIQQAKGRIPSLVTGVVRDSTLVWSAARGTFPDGVDGLDLQYRIGSITKTFVAVAVMRLRDAGRVRLNDPIDIHVPGTPFGDVTVAQLLSHTAGVSAELPGSWWERSPGLDTAQLHAAWEHGTVLDRPGRRFHYSNLGFAVLGELVARAAGRDWDAVITDDILSPLGMAHTSALPQPLHAKGWAVHPHADVLLPEVVADTAMMGPAGQLWSTVPDLARWAAFMMGDTAGVLSPDTLAEMCEPQTFNDGKTWTSAHGLGFQLWRVKGRTLVGHGGSMPGFQAGLRVDRDTSTATMDVLNCTTPTKVDGLEDVFDIMDECQPRLPQPWVADPSVPAELLALTGAWFWGTSQGDIRVESQGWLKMEAVSGMASTSRFRPNGDGTWTGLDGYYRNEILRVVRDANGTVTHLDVGTFVFTRRSYEPGDVIPGGLGEGGWPLS